MTSMNAYMGPYAISNVYANSSKVLVDVEGGNNLMYLPLDKLMSGRSSDIEGSTNDQPVSDIADQVIEELRSRNTRTTREGR